MGAKLDKKWFVGAILYNPVDDDIVEVFHIFIYRLKFKILLKESDDDYRVVTAVPVGTPGVAEWTLLGDVNVKGLQNGI